MASRSLGTLTLDLIARIGGFESGMDRAARTAARRSREIARDAARRAQETQEAWSKVGNVIGGVFAGITFGAVFQKFIAETKAAEQEQAQLAAVLTSTGNAAGYSQGRLNEMADAMQDSLGIAAGDVNQAQTVLLAFTNIVGVNLPDALQAAADHAARTGSTLKASAEIMGRALDVPSVGMASLQKQGFKFSESQIEVARELERTGKIAEAQQMVLGSLNESYGGAAAAARDTFGGALTALQNTINDLLTGDSGSMAKMKESVEAMNSTLSDEQTRAAFQTLIGWMVDLSTATIQGTANIVAFINTKNKLSVILGTDEFGKMTADAEGYSHQLTELTSKAERMQEALSRNPDDKNMQRMLSNVRAKITEVSGKALQASQQLKDFADLQSPAPSSATALGPDLKPKSPGIVNLKDGEKAKADPSVNAAKAYIQQLHDQIGKVNELTTAERVLYDLQLGKAKLTHAQKDIALGLAQEIDATKELEKQRARDLAAAQSQTSAQRELNDTLEQYTRTLDGIGLSDSEQQRLAGLTQIAEKYTADLRRLDDDRRSAQFVGKWTTEAQKQYDDELLLIGEFQQKALTSFGTYYDQLSAKQGDWALGAQRALLNYADESSNVFAQTESLVTNAFKGMEDALVSFATTGKMDFKSLANSIISDLIRIQIRSAAVSFLSGMLGGSMQAAFSGTAVGASGFGSGMAYGNQDMGQYFSGGGYTGAGGKYEPAGIVHAGEVVWSQDDIRKAGGVGVVEAMRRGGRGYAEGGVVAMERPPAIAMRGASGQAAGLNITTNVTVDGGGQSSAGQGATEAHGRALSAMVTQTVREVVAKENRQGGLLWKMRNGY